MTTANPSLKLIYNEQPTGKLKRKRFFSTEIYVGNSTELAYMSPTLLNCVKPPTYNRWEELRKTVIYHEHISTPIL